MRSVFRIFVRKHQISTSLSTVSGYCYCQSQRNFVRGGIVDAVGLGWDTLVGF